MAGYTLALTILALIGTTCVLTTEASQESIQDTGDNRPEDVSLESGEQNESPFSGPGNSFQILGKAELNSQDDDSNNEQSFESGDEAFPGPQSPFLPFQQRKQLFRPVPPGGRPAGGYQALPATTRIHANSDSRESEESDEDVPDQLVPGRFTINVQPGPNLYNAPRPRPGPNSFFGLPRPGQNSFLNPRPFPGNYFYFGPRPRPGFGFGHHGPHRRPGHGRRPCKKPTTQQPLYSTTENIRQGSSTSSTQLSTTVSPALVSSPVTSGSQLLTTPAVTQ